MNTSIKCKKIQWKVVHDSPAQDFGYTAIGHLEDPGDVAGASSAVR